MKTVARLIPLVVALAALPALGRAAAPPVAKKAAAAPLHCVVTGEEIAKAADASGKVEYKGKTYYFCCAACEPAFQKSPAKFAQLSGLRDDLRGAEANYAAAKTPPGKVAAAKTVATLKAKIAEAEKGAPRAHEDETAAAPAAVTTLHCAITDEMIASPEASAGTSAFNNKTYYFCCPGCKTKFDKDPATLAAVADKKTAERAGAKN